MTKGYVRIVYNSKVIMPVIRFGDPDTLCDIGKYRSVGHTDMLNISVRPYIYQTPLMHSNVSIIFVAF